MLVELEDFGAAVLPIVGGQHFTLAVGEGERVGKGRGFGQRVKVGGLGAGGLLPLGEGGNGGDDLAEFIPVLLAFLGRHRQEGGG